MDALDARLHARRVFLISDIHGSIEPLLQLLIQSRLVSVHEHGRRQYVKWTDEECEDSAVVILGDLTARHRNEKGSEGELKNEELRIVILIYHLNATHPRFKNAIISIIGNHDLNNLMLSPLVNRFSSQNCLNFCEKRYGEVRTNIEMMGRRKLFYGCNEILDTEKRKICEDIVVHGSWPSMPLFYKDFLQNYDVAAFFPEHKLLLVHGGIGDFRKSMRHLSKQALHDSIASNRLYLSNNTDFVVWAERVNEMSRCMIEPLAWQLLVLKCKRPVHQVQVDCPDPECIDGVETRLLDPVFTFDVVMVVEDFADHKKILPCHCAICNNLLQGRADLPALLQQ